MCVEEHLLNDPAARYYAASKGITKSDFLVIVAESGLNLSQFSALLPVSKRTIEKVKDEELLSPVVSDRVLQLASLFSHGTLVLGSKEDFQDWLHGSLIALGGKKPINFITNDTGISMVRDLLGRIEHGVYS